MSNEYPHGIMFHYFHDSNEFMRQQGSISAEELHDILCALKKRYHILSALDFLERSSSNSLHSDDIVLTFDDNLKCQYYIAKPVLDDLCIKAFWFVNTLCFEQGYNLMDVFRHFRNKYFEDINEFYSVFLKKAMEFMCSEDVIGLNAFHPNEYLSECPFYTDEDRKFKYIRDEILRTDQYNEIMLALMEERGFDYKTASLWMQESQLRELQEESHMIGLHSHSHPMRMDKLSTTEQIEEYHMNYNILKSILNKDIISVSYPCGVYTYDSLCELSKMGIIIGFIDYYGHKRAENNLLFPREDHSNIMNCMRG